MIQGCEGRVGAAPQRGAAKRLSAQNAKKRGGKKLAPGPSRGHKGRAFSFWRAGKAPEVTGTGSPQSATVPWTQISGRRSFEASVHVKAAAFIPALAEI